MDPMSSDVSGLKEKFVSPSIEPIVPMLPPPTLPWLVLPLRPLLNMPGRFRLPPTMLLPEEMLLPAPPMLPFRSAGVGLEDDCAAAAAARGRTEITNLSLDIASVAGSNFPLALTLKTLIPRKSDSGTDMCSRADLKLLRCLLGCCCCCEDDDCDCCPPPPSR